MLFPERGGTRVDGGGFGYSEYPSRDCLYTKGFMKHFFERVLIVVLRFVLGCKRRTR